MFTIVVVLDDVVFDLEYAVVLPTLICAASPATAILSLSIVVDSSASLMITAVLFATTLAA